MKAKTQIENYSKCMHEIKERTVLFKNALSPWITEQIASVGNCELAALQLRKIYELIAFSSLCANIDEYSKARTAFEKDWRIRDIVRTIEKNNPKGLPCPVSIKKRSDGVADWHITSKWEAAITASEIIKEHGELGSILHSPNPFTKSLNIESVFPRLVKKMNRVFEVMNEHAIQVLEAEFGFLVQMKPDGEPVNVKTFEKQE